jgi:hypothetical protein
MESSRRHTRSFFESPSRAFHAPCLLISSDLHQRHHATSFNRSTKTERADGRRMDSNIGQSHGCDVLTAQI